MNADCEAIAISCAQLVKLQYAAKGLSLKKHRRVQHYQMGGHYSCHKGRGLDFEEVRLYQMGDDIRHMDWRVTARTGEAHTKVYQEERERPVHLLVDFSPSLFFGTRVTFKSVIAAQVAAIVGWASVQEGDRVGAVLITQDGLIKVPLGARQRGMVPLLKQLSKATANAPSHTTRQENGINKGLLYLRETVTPGSLVMLISDFQGINENTAQHFSQLARNNDCFASIISDPMEVEPPPPNRYSITDGSAQCLMDTTQKSFCENYRKRFLSHQETIENNLRESGIPFFHISTQGCVERTVKTFFA